MITAVINPDNSLTFNGQTALQEADGCWMIERTLFRQVNGEIQAFPADAGPFSAESGQFPEHAEHVYVNLMAEYYFVVPSA